MEDIPGLDTVVDLFPSKPRTELASRLLCSSSVDALVEELLLEETQPSSGYSQDVQNIKLMFPRAKKSEIAAELQRNGNDVDATINKFMAANPAAELSKLLGLAENKIQPYLELHKNDFFRALADTLAHYRTQKKAWTSRVQDRKSSTMKDAYTFSEKTPEAHELHRYIQAEPVLKHLNYDFLVKSLIFFQGNVLKVLEVARLFIEAKKTHITYEPKLGFVYRSFPDSPPPPSTSEVLKQTVQQKLSSMPTLADSRSVKSSSGATYNASARPQCSMYSSSSNLPSSGGASKSSIGSVGGTLDLHGYTVTEAVSMTRSALEAWWNQEKEMRVAEGLLHQHGAKADFVPPLVIITGRGLHSAGAPKISASVLRLLREGNYIISENIGNVSVYGKRK